MKRFLSLLLCLAVLLAALPLYTPAAQAADVDLSTEHQLDSIVIGFYDRSLFPGKEKQYDDEVSKVLKDGLTEIGLNMYLVQAEDFAKNPNATLNKYKNSKFIEYCEPNYIVKTEYIPNDPSYKTLSAVLTSIGAQNGWDITTGGGPIVAVVDSGVAKHSDLPTLLAGYSSVASLSANNDKLGHGTGVAGTIGAIGDNALGGAGINWDATIMPVKVDDAAGTMTVANVAKGIIWAADNGARIINLSLGTAADSVTMKNAINYAYNKGCAIFAATGNENAPTLCYPARYPNVMAVGATGNGKTRAAISNYGDGMGVVAVTSYYTTTASGGFSAMSGTSFSTPQVTGLASLIWALNPDLTNDEVYSYIQQGAKPLDGGYNEQTGYGIIDIGNTLKLVQEGMGAPAKNLTPPQLTLKGNTSMEILQNSAYVEPGFTATDNTGKDITARVTITGSVDVKTPGVYRLEYSVTDDNSSTTLATRVVEVLLVDSQPPIIILAGDAKVSVMQGNAYVEPGFTAVDDINGDVTRNVTVTGNVNTALPGTYTLTYTVTDAAGNVATATRQVEVVMADRTPPVLTLSGSQSITLDQGTSYAEPGYTATDNVDGNLATAVNVTGSVDSQTPGVYTLTYTVTDAAGNKATAQRVVTIAAPLVKVEYKTPPTITLRGSGQISLFTEDTFAEPGYTAVDCLGTNLTGVVKVTHNINVYTPGLYTVEYVVEDAGGNTARESRVVIVLEREEPPRPASAPILTIIGSDPIVLHLDSDTSYVEQGAKAIDEQDGDISHLVQISGSVNRHRAGTYTLTYSVVNSMGLEATATRTVQILAPTETALPRQTYNFSGSGKAGVTTTHKGVVAEEAGYMDFAVTSIDKGSALEIKIANQNTGEIVYTDYYTSLGGNQFWVEAGVYSISVSIVSGNGNCKYGVKAITPESLLVEFVSEEIPLVSSEFILYLIGQGDSPLEICLKLCMSPGELDAYYDDFMAAGWLSTELTWYGLSESILMDVPLGNLPATGDFSSTEWSWSIVVLALAAMLIIDKRRTVNSNGYISA